MLFPDLLAQLEAVHIREHHIQYGQIQLLCFDAAERIHSVVKFKNLKIFIFKIKGDEIGYFMLVIDNQYFISLHKEPLSAVQDILSAQVLLLLFYQSFPGFCTYAAFLLKQCWGILPKTKRK